jgi:hypothetical protein
MSGVVPWETDDPRRAATELQAYPVRERGASGGSSPPPKRDSNGRFHPDRRPPTGKVHPAYETHSQGVRGMPFVPPRTIIPLKREGAKGSDAAAWGGDDTGHAACPLIVTIRNAGGGVRRR